MTSTATGSAFSASAERDVLVAVRENRAAARAVEIECAELVVSWVAERAIDPDQHSAGAVGVYDPEVDIEVPGSTVPGTEEPMRLAGAGAPWVSDLGFARLATTLGQSNEAALSYVGAVVELAYRLPTLWGRVRAGQVSMNRARAVTRLTKKLPFEGAGWVDRQVAWSIGSCSRAQIERAVAAAMDHYDPEQARAEAQAALEARRVEIHLGDAGDPHLPGSTAVVNFEGGLDLADALDLEAAVAARAAALRAFMPDASEDVRRSIALGDLARGQVSLPAGAVGAETDGGAAASAETASIGDVSAGSTSIGTCSRGSTPSTPSAPSTPGAAGGSGPVADPGVNGRTVMLYLHLAATTDLTGAADLADAGDVAGAGGGGFGPGAVGRCENTRSPVTTEQVRSWCGAARSVIVRPVIDLAEDYSATTYEASPKLREQAILRDRTCAFPFCNRSARSADRDHITPHEQGGPTSSANLGSLCRRHHRCKTHDGWSYVMLNPGTYYWCDPHGTQYLVTPASTFLLPGTRGGPVIRARQRALASMRAAAQGMPTRRHQVRPPTGEHAPASTTHQTTAHTSGGSTSRTGRVAGTGGTDPPPF